MHAGQYALYPHFRSDGWIYFLVRDKVTNKEYAVASDAALTCKLPMRCAQPVLVSCSRLRRQRRDKTAACQLGSTRVGGDGAGPQGDRRRGGVHAGSRARGSRRRAADLDRGATRGGVAGRRQGARADAARRADAAVSRSSCRRGTRGSRATTSIACSRSCTATSDPAGRRARAPFDAPTIDAGFEWNTTALDELTPTGRRSATPTTSPRSTRRTRRRASRARIASATARVRCAS